MLRRSIRRLAFALVPVVVLVVTVEVGFRLRAREDSYQTHAGLVEPDPRTIWRLKPQAGPLALNELGHRDTPVRRDATRRILLLGDSVSWGNGVRETSRVYPQVLERRLSALSGETLEIMNSSVPGWSTFQELRYLEDHGVALSPDAVVVQFCLNDVGERYESLAELGGNRSFLGVDTRTEVRGAYGWLLRRSRAFEELARTWQRRAVKVESLRGRGLAVDQLDEEQERAWGAMIEELDSIRELTEERGWPLLVIVAPYRFQIQGGRQPQGRLAEWGDAKNVAIVDLLEPLSSIPRRAAEIAFNDETHFSRAGHWLVADFLLESIAELVSVEVDREGGRELAARLSIEARAAAERGDLVQARRAAAAAADLAGDEPAMLVNVANVEFLGGNIGPALAAVEAALLLDPDDPQLWGNRAALIGQGGAGRAIR